MSIRSVSPFVLVLLAVLGLAGCERKQSGPDSAGTASLGTVKGSAAGTNWLVPKRWTHESDRPMRVATYSVPAASGDAEGGECAVSYFGRGEGGPVEMNIDRWISQFKDPDTPRRSSRKVSGLDVSLVRITGTYLLPGGPMMQSQGEKPGYGMIGAIVEAPEGMLFFKLTGPAKTLRSADAEFEALVGSLSK